LKQREDENKLSFKKKSAEEISNDMTVGNRAPTNYLSNDPYLDGNSQYRPNLLSKI
jgi:hypothetical protein